MSADSCRSAVHENCLNGMQGLEMDSEFTFASTPRRKKSKSGILVPIYDFDFHGGSVVNLQQKKLSRRAAQHFFGEIVEREKAYRYNIKQ